MTVRLTEPVWRIIAGILLAWLLLVLFLVSLASARVVRSRAQVRAFKQEAICPATGKIEVDTSCEKDGVRYVVDHKEPICAGGADTPENMQYQEYQQSLVKDVLERRVCRLMSQLDVARTKLKEAEARCPSSP